LATGALALLLGDEPLELLGGATCRLSRRHEGRHTNDHKEQFSHFAVQVLCFRWSTHNSPLRWHNCV